MTASDLSAKELARDILDKNDDINPLFEDVVKHIKLLRQTGLPDEKIRQTVPGMYRLKEEAAKEGAMGEPNAEEIRVISMPSQYQRENWR